MTHSDDLVFEKSFRLRKLNYSSKYVYDPSIVIFKSFLNRETNIIHIYAPSTGLEFSLKMLFFKFLITITVQILSMYLFRNQINDYLKGNQQHSDRGHHRQWFFFNTEANKIFLQPFLAGLKT